MHPVFLHGLGQTCADWEKVNIEAPEKLAELLRGFYKRVK